VTDIESHSRSSEIARFDKLTSRSPLPIMSPRISPLWSVGVDTGAWAL